MVWNAFSCPFCEASFNKADNMKYHIKRIHTTYKPEDCHCEPCDKNFKNPDCLKSHVKEFHTPGIDRTPQLCTHCGKSFNKKSNLKVIFKIVTQNIIPVIVFVANAEKCSKIL